MGKLVSGNYQAAGKKMEGATPESNFYKPPKPAVVKPDMAAPAAPTRPFLRQAIPGMGGGMRSANVGGIQRAYPTTVNVPGHQSMAHKINPGE